jgi:hypothetical protein
LIKIVSIFILSALFLYSCSDEVIQPLEQETLLYQEQGLVDSAVVYGCYAYTVRHFTNDTLELNNYTKLKVDFDGFANSDGSKISLIYNTSSSQNNFVYEVENQQMINKLHSYTFTKPDNMLWFELRLYINPPVCGENEFKYTRARDLKIYGIK